MINIEQLISEVHRAGASDLHLATGLKPRYRKDGDLVIMDADVITHEDAVELAKRLANYEELKKNRAYDAAETISGVRCRINAYGRSGSWSFALRLLNDHIPAIKEIGLPKLALEFPYYNQGIVLVTGETGSGKSTTLAAIIEEINKTKKQHIITLEDPIEYVYTSKQCLINQREVGRDTLSFTNGLREALREDPDVILIGEMRDVDTIETALTAAETGHLVFGTIHTNSCADSIDRIVSTFPSFKQPQVRLQLSMTLKAVITQQLVKKIEGGRMLCCEVMKLDGAIRNLIREGKTPQIENVIQTTRASGNILMETALKELYERKLITRETMRNASRDADASVDSDIFKQTTRLL